MSRQTTAILGLIAAALFTYIYAFERDSVTSSATSSTLYLNSDRSFALVVTG